MELAAFLRIAGIAIALSPFASKAQISAPDSFVGDFWVPSGFNRDQITLNSSGTFFDPGTRFDRFSPGITGVWNYTKTDVNTAFLVLQYNGSPPLFGGHPLARQEIELRFSWKDGPVFNGIAKADTYNTQGGYTVGDWTWNIMFRPASLDLKCDSLNWNYTLGGVDCAYSIIGGPLNNATTAKLFWAAGTTIESILPGNPVMTEIIPSGSNGQGKVVHVPSASLANSPDEATHLIFVIDPSLATAESAEDNNAASLKLPVISNLRVKQRIGPGDDSPDKYVDIDYDIAGGPFPPLPVTLQVYRPLLEEPLPIQTLTGDVGPAVTAGSGRRITWQAGRDWNGKYLQFVEFKVKAPGPSAKAVISVDTRNYLGLARALGDRNRSLYGEANRIQPLVDDFNDYTPDRIEVVPVPIYFDVFQRYQVRISPKIPERAERYYECYEFLNSLPEGPLGEIKDLVEIVTASSWASVINLSAAYLVKQNVVPIVAAAFDIGERALALIDLSPSRSDPMSQDEALEFAYPLRLEMWKARVQLAKYVAHFNQQLDIHGADLLNFQKTIGTAPIPDSVAEIILNVHLNIPPPPKFPVLDPGLSPEIPGGAGAALWAFPYIYVDQSDTLILNLDGAGPSEGEQNKPAPKNVKGPMHAATGAAIRYRWLKYDFDGSLRSTLHEGTESDPGQPSLQLTNSQPDISGVYVVVALDADGSIVKIKSFNIVARTGIEAPPSVPTKDYSIKYKRGSLAALSVSVTCQSPFRVDWFKDNLLFRENAGSLLNLGQMTPAQAGTYWAVVKNSAGQVTSGKIQVSLADFAYSDYQQWAASIADPAQRSHDSSPMRDGVPNLFKYAQGLNALEAVPAGRVPKMLRVPETGELFFSFIVAKGAPGVTVDAEQTDQFGATNWITVPSLKAVDDGVLENWIVPATASRPLEFFRLRIKGEP